MGASKRGDCGRRISPFPRSTHGPAPASGRLGHISGPGRCLPFSRVTQSHTAPGLVALRPRHSAPCPPQRLVFLWPVGRGPGHFCFLLSEVGSAGGETQGQFRAGKWRTRAPPWQPRKSEASRGTPTPLTLTQPLHPWPWGVAVLTVCYALCYGLATPQMGPVRHCSLPPERVEVLDRRPPFSVALQICFHDNTCQSLLGTC